MTTNSLTIATSVARNNSRMNKERTFIVVVTRSGSYDVVTSNGLQDDMRKLMAYRNGRKIY